MAHPYPGIFITFEGPEGGGKTLAIARLHDELKAQNLPVIMTREPGGTVIGDKFRDIAHDLANENLSELASAWAYQGSRAQHVHELILPSLLAGKIILCDRYTDSTLAYQGHGWGLGCGRLDWVNGWSTQGIKPDLTILFDLSVEVGLERRRAGAGEWNRMDALAIEFHQQVREAYLAMAKYERTYNPGPEDRWAVIDAEQDKESVYCDVRRVVEARLISRDFIERNLPSLERRG